jgi:hypothetical protein
MCSRSVSGRELQNQQKGGCLVLRRFFDVIDHEGFDSVKRVASAVGEGSIAISFVHQILQE